MQFSGSKIVRAGLSLAVGSFAGDALFAQSFPAQINLPDDGGERVTVVEGVIDGGATGRHVFDAGDLNDDGVTDLLVTAPTTQVSGKNNAGAAYVLFGGPSLGQVLLLDLASLDGSNGFEVLGLDAQHFTGSSGGFAGDVNADGVDDLLIGASGANVGPGFSRGSVYVLFGSAGIGGTGSFDLASLDGSNGFVVEGADLGDHLGSAASRVGDVNADRIDDFIIGAPDAGAPAALFDVSTTEVYSVSGGDFDQDLDVDLISVSQGGQYFTIQYNDGVGNLTPVNYPLAGFPRDVIAADFDGNGISDLVATTWNGTVGQISLVLSTGPGAFAAPVVYPMDMEDRMSMAVGDLNGDSFPDLVATSYDPAITATSGKLYIFANNQSGGFNSLPPKTTLGHPSLVDVGDFDGDQDEDIVVYEANADQLGFWRNNGGGSFTKVQTVGTLDINAMAVGDVDGDLDVDILGTGFNLNWFHNQGNGSIAFTASSVDVMNDDGISIQLVDLDDDVDLDVCIGTDSTSESQLAVLENLGAGVMSAARSFSAPVSIVWDLHMADIDGDSALDAFGAMKEFNFGTNGDVGMLLGNGDATFHGAKRGEAYVVFGGSGVGGSGYLSVGDLDGTNGFLMEGHAGLDKLGTSVAGLGDVNDDGQPDFAVGAIHAHTGGTESGSVYVVLGAAALGAGGALDLSALSASEGFEITGPFERSGIGSSLAGVGDFDGDDLPDIAIGASTVFVGQAHAPGVAYLVRGGAGAVDLGALDGSDGFRVEGIQSEDGMGCSLSLGADFDDDGLNDWVIGANTHDGNFAGAGRALVVFGREGNLFGGFLNPDSLDGINGFTVEGETADASLGSSVAGIMDADGDAVDDIVLGEPDVVAGPGLKGRAFVFYGRDPDPQIYCTAGTSASGCQALLSASGAASATAISGFSLQASTVEGSKDGLYFFGTNGQQANPWGNGNSYQCVIPPVKRAPIMNGSGTISLCDGAFALDLNALWCPSCPKPGHNPGVGATVQAQLWYRDPANTSNQTTSLSDAIEFVVGP